MDEVGRYRQYAAHCLQAAQESSSLEVRASLVVMAQIWKALADQIDGDTGLHHLLAFVQPGSEKQK